MTAIADSASQPGHGLSQQGPGLSIIVPANNEEAFLAKCLGALLESAPVDVPVQVIVVANACTDKTVDVALSFSSAAESIGWGFQVLDLSQPGKLNALNVGDAIATGSLRIYLDADVEVSPLLVSQVVAALRSSSDALYVSGTPRVARARSLVTRAYARFWQLLPFARSEAPGFGLFAVNAAGRARWGAFPDIISDDTYVRLLFAPHERKGVMATYQWPMVEGFSHLVKVRRRQDQGVLEIARKWPDLLRNEGKPKLGLVGLLSTAIREPVGCLVYGVVAIAVRSRRASAEWTRGR